MITYDLIIQHTRLFGVLWNLFVSTDVLKLYCYVLKTVKYSQCFERQHWNHTGGKSLIFLFWLLLLDINLNIFTFFSLTLFPFLLFFFFSSSDYTFSFFKPLLSCCSFFSPLTLQFRSCIGLIDNAVLSHFFKSTVRRNNVGGNWSGIKFIDRTHIFPNPVTPFRNLYTVIPHIWGENKFQKENNWEKRKLSKPSLLHHKTKKFEKIVLNISVACDILFPLFVLTFFFLLKGCEFCDDWWWVISFLKSWDKNDWKQKSIRKKELNI